MGLACHGDLAFLHRLEKGCLDFRRRTVDLVGQDNVGEDRARLEDEPFCGILAEIHFRARDIGWQQVGCELDAAEFRFEIAGETLDRARLGQPGESLDKHVAVTEQGQQEALDHCVLADNRASHTLPEVIDCLS